MGAGALGISSLVSGGMTSAAAKTPALPTHGPALDAIVLGAGISGLQTAWLLEQEGMKVAVIEARQRVGGRVYTLTDEPGYPEMGFNAMGAGYGRGIDAAQRAKVPLVNVAASYQTDPPMLWMNGKPFTREEWAKFPGNPFPDALKSNLPGEVVFKLISEHNRLKDWASWMDPESKALDISLHEFLRQQGLSDEAIRLANDVSPYYGRNAHDVSALMLEFSDGWVKTQYDMGSQAFAVRGGNIQLPIAMAQMLKGDVLLGKEVIAIESGATEATVHCSDGSRFSAAKVVSSLPFSALRHVKIMPGLTGPQARAVASLPYQPLSMIFLTATSPFWEEDKLPPAMWTVDGVGTVIPQRFGRTVDEITGFLVQFRGESAFYWDRMGPELAMQRVVAKIEEMRPAAKGKLRARRYFSWSGESFNGGDFSYFGPGDISGYINEMAEPAGRLHFCGEHTARAARGLEGAMESAERVALELLL
jgi:monoamine oxidase